MVRTVLAAASLSALLISIPGSANAEARTCGGTTVMLDTEKSGPMRKGPDRNGSEGILWCESADDPRCAPIGQAPEAPRSSSSPLFALACSAAPTWASESGGTDTYGAESGSPRLGVRLRVDRPPQI